MYKHLIDIDLSEHPNPEEFINSMRENYPDENVNLKLKGEKMEVTINPEVPLQLKINVASYLEREAKNKISL